MTVSVEGNGDDLVMNHSLCGGDQHEYGEYLVVHPKRRPDESVNTKCLRECVTVPQQNDKQAADRRMH